MMGDVALIVSTSGVGRAPLPTARQPRIPYTRAVRLIQVNDDSWSGSQSYKETAPWPALSRWGALVLEERSWTKDRVVGSAKQVKGAVKQAVGKAVGDAKLESEGKADKIEGKVQHAIGLKDTLKGK